jgi:hypothetical protein
MSKDTWKAEKKKEYIIKMDLREVDCEGGKWMELALVVGFGFSGAEILTDNWLHIYLFI